MAVPTRRGRISSGMPGGPAVPPGCWHALDAVWGSAQRVRLVTGPPSLVGDSAQIRSIHIVGVIPDSENPAKLLLVQNKDGSFTFPGGRLEARESLAEALVREVWEEARATIAPEWRPVAATRIEYLNRVPGRIHRFHPTYLLWVTGEIAFLSDEPHDDPAESVIGRRVVTAEEAVGLLDPLEQTVLHSALAARGGAGAS
ncbi:MAG: NUDIX domain-containing protein [Cytophagales bacterium]|nr:NUDIX domain-containing protein [Armatimonadota bacterium]